MKKIKLTKDKYAIVDDEDFVFLNRMAWFPEDLKYEWHFWHDCMFCGKNGWDALHHIITPTNREYIAGNHNKSILNSCPIHNFRSDDKATQNCHIGNESELHKQIPKLLAKTLYALIYDQDYTLKEIDKKFLSIYSEIYDKRIGKGYSERYLT